MPAHTPDKSSGGRTNSVNKRKTVALVSFAAIVLAGAVALSVWRNSAASMTSDKSIALVPPVRCIDLVERAVPIRESFYGLFEANVQVGLAFRVAGQIETIGKRSTDDPARYVYVIDEGSVVGAGDQLMRLDGDQLEARVASAQAYVKSAEAELAAARGRLESAQARVEMARAVRDEAQADFQRELDEFVRIANLFEDDSASTTEMDRARTAKQAANARLTGAKAALVQAEGDLQTARADIQSCEATLLRRQADLDTAQLDLSYATLNAPFDAVVSRVWVEENQTISVGQVVVTVIDVSKVKLVVGVVERKIADLQVGAAARVYVEALAKAGTLSSLGREFDGCVSMVDVAADETTGLFNVEITVDNADGTIKPGMIGKCELIVSQPTCYAIPVDAAIFKGDHITVFFLDGGTGTDLLKAVAFDLKPLGETEEYFLAKELPTDHRRLIVEGHRRLRSGTSVRVLHDDPDPHTED